MLNLLGEASATVASVGVRNRATLVGNLCSAVPSCDAGPALLVHDAVLRVTGPDADREIPIAEWFEGVGHDVELPRRGVEGCPLWNSCWRSR